MNILGMLSKGLRTLLVGFVGIVATCVALSLTVALAALLWLLVVIGSFLKGVFATATFGGIAVETILTIAEQTIKAIWNSETNIAEQ